jgi:hypothetical protein
MMGEQQTLGLACDTSHLEFYSSSAADPSKRLGSLVPRVRDIETY